MNERIKELAEQAGLKVNADGEIGPAYFGSVDAGYRKFTELIVRECAEFVRKQNYESIRNEEPYNVTSTDILKHFGVEE